MTMSSFQVHDFNLMVRGCILSVLMPKLLRDDPKKAELEALQCGVSVLGLEGGGTL